MAEPRTDLQRLLDEAPFVQALARRLVRDADDDVVQQAWLQALENRPGRLADPRRWLSRVVRNLVADRRRRDRRRRQRERLAARPAAAAAPSSVELLEIEERRRALIAAIDALPEEQRAVVLLRYYEGLPPRRIAKKLGVSARSVHNRLYAALRTLRNRLDRDHGARRAWLLALVPLAAAPRALPWREVLAEAAPPTLFTGLIAMTTKSKLVAAGAAVLALILAWAAWPRGDRFVPPTADGTEPGPLVAAASPDEPSATPTAGEPRREVPQAAPAAAATTGSLAVRVMHESEPTAGAGVMVTVFRRGGDFRVGARKLVTDAEGRAAFAELAPGSYTVRAARDGAGARVEVRAGETTEHDLRLSPSFVLTGVVVDATGTPVPGALVEAGWAGGSGADIEVVATAAADGTFTVRDCYRHCQVGARAHGFASSALQYVEGEPGERRHVRIELREPGGAVEGLVVGADGTPVADAVVKAGAGNTSSIRSTPMGAAPVPALVRTDSGGRFRAIGLPAGEQPLAARAPGFAPWSGTCEVAAGFTAPAHIVMQPGVRCLGSVRTAAGEPVAEVRVTAGPTGDFTELVRYTDAGGAFVMEGLAAGTTGIEAWHQEHGRASANVDGAAGETVRCELVLSKGVVLRGRVVDEDDAAVSGATIQCHSTEPPWFIGWDRTGDDGRFEVNSCPAGQRLDLTANASGRGPVARRDVDPAAGELLIVMSMNTPRARITGRVLTPDGRPAAGAELRAIMRDRNLNAFAEPAADGSFVLEVAEGEWRFQCEHRDHPRVRAGPLALRPGEVWDLGVVMLTHGGRVVVRNGETEEVPDKISYLVFDTAEEFVCGLYNPDPPPRSELLAPGDYLLLLRGERVAAQSVPFSVRAGETTEVEVRLERGVPQRIEFAAGPGVELDRSVPFRLHRDGKLLAVSSASGDPPARDLWLEPGSYTLTTRDREPVTILDFTVGRSAGNPLRVELR